MCNNVLFIYRIIFFKLKIKLCIHTYEYSFYSFILSPQTTFSTQGTNTIICRFYFPTPRTTNYINNRQQQQQKSTAILLNKRCKKTEGKAKLQNFKIILYKTLHVTIMASHLCNVTSLERKLNIVF